ncbi:RNA helicase Mov10l1-like [Argonauta hians]
MFNALTKFANFLWKEDVPRRQSFSSSVDGVVVRSRSWERTKSTEENTRTFTGYITNVFGNHGLIDGDVYFSYSVIVGSQRPQEGNEVSVIASRQHREGGWYADQVIILKQWAEENDSDNSDDSKETESVSNGVVQELAPGVGTITQCHLGEGLINEDIPFRIENCVKGFIPEVGDWVTVDLRETNGEVVAFDVQPLRQQEFTSEVSVVLRDHGYIQKDIFFFLKSCATGYKPKCRDQVCCTAIESKQGKCNWRAISVSRLARSPHNQVVSAPHSNYLGDLLKDKEGILISGISDFGKMTKEENKVITLWIRNNGPHPQTLLEIQLPTEEKQFCVEHLKVLKELMASSKSPSSSKEVTCPLVLKPKMAAYVNISCSTKYVGKHKVLLVFKFDKFRIGRHVTVTVVDPYQNYMPQQDQAAASTNPTKTSFNRFKESADQSWIIPGEKVSRFSKQQLPKRLGQYRVPQEIRNAILNTDDIREVLPILEKTLCYENYDSKFSTLLYLEEIQLDIDIRAFDLEQVCLNLVGEYLSLRVPGLAEGRPSVLVGDRVYLSTPGTEGGPLFEGIVHEVHSEDVFLKFNAEFHSKYLGEDYNVRFTFNRTPLRRFHQAAEFAPNLGRNVLFPTSIETQPPRYNPSSDKTSPDASYLTPTKSTSRADISSQLTLQFFNRQLNDRQMSAVKRILLGQCRPAPYILFGPPGTGKTITLVETILQILTKLPGSRILACAPSNSASDLLTERLHKSGVLKLSDMVRLNAFQRNEEAIPDKIRPYCSSGNNLDIVVHYRIIISTCVNSGLLYSYGLNPGHFTHVFIDEAGQATEPECLIPMGLVAGTDGQIILSGDPEQLGPVLHSKHAKAYGLECPLLERIMASELYSRDETKFVTSGCYNPMLVTKLIYNYRSHPALLHLPSVLFYANELEMKADKTLTHSLCGWNSLPNKTVPILFHGIRGEDLREGNCPSWFNPFETVQVVRYLQGLLADYSSYLTEEDIGIITPYRKQVEKIRLLLAHLGRDTVKVGSVEEFQGQERKAIIVSTVRTNEELMGFDQRHILGFLCHPKRFNVCISRAQALLIIVGNPYVLMHDFYWLTLLKYCVENNAYTGCELPEKVTAACDS